MKWSWGHWLDRVGWHFDELRFRKQRAQAVARLEAALAARTPGRHLLFRVEDLFEEQAYGRMRTPAANDNEPDHYEILQISPKADVQTSRVMTF